MLGDCTRALSGASIEPDVVLVSRAEAVRPLQCRDVCKKACPHYYDQAVETASCVDGCQIDARHLQSPDDMDQYCHELKGNTTTYATRRRACAAD